ncbi:PREDICTED: uncharacterized protein LOC108610271 [Drosophila arizonae]|uniref:Uncharacterized protein LOC108610271 n=1 Tax=Drosophila arizonae TaxID=7263 RepID=A0ABM1NS22_DROAR|nr:PREDICTED: uncharacterized protein LOC108610271 [Drosophila arizonae]
MASIEAVLVAGVMHLVLQYSLYITPLTTFSTPGPTLPTIIVCVALLDIIYANDIVPLCMDERPMVFKYIAECLVAIFILEVGMLVFWQTLEHVVVMIARTLLLGKELVSSEYYYEHEAVLIGAFTVPVSLIVLATVVSFTNHMPKLCDRYISRQMQVHLNLDKAVDFLSRSDRYKDSRFRELLCTYNANAAEAHNPSWVKYFQNEK